MLLCPRLELYTYFPVGCTCTSAPVFPGMAVGSAETVWITESRPVDRSYLREVTALLSSLIRNAKSPFGCHARCRGPGFVPGMTRAAGEFGVSAPVAASNR